MTIFKIKRSTCFYEDYKYDIVLKKTIKYLQEAHLRNKWKVHRNIFNKDWQVWYKPYTITVLNKEFNIYFPIKIKSYNWNPFTPITITKEIKAGIISKMPEIDLHIITNILMHKKELEKSRLFTIIND